MRDYSLYVKREPTDVKVHFSFHFSRKQTVNKK